MKILLLVSLITLSFSDSLITAKKTKGTTVVGSFNKLLGSNSIELDGDYNIVLSSDDSKIIGSKNIVADSYNTTLVGSENNVKKSNRNIIRGG